MPSTFIINMTGLILHVGEDADTADLEKKHAAIIHDPHGHVGMVVVNGTDLKTAQPAPYVLLLQKDDSITFDLTAGTAKTTPKFRDTTPPLKLLIKHPTPGVTPDLDPAVKTGIAHKNVAAYVIYPEGSLDVTKTYDNEVTYGFVQTGVLRRSCAAQRTAFMADTNLTWVTMTVTHKNGAPTVVEISAGATIAIANDASSGKHFDKFAGVMIDDTMLAMAEEDPLTPCVSAAPPPTILVAPHPECSSSQWP